jgi:hypothetical protein
VADGEFTEDVEIHVRPSGMAETADELEALDEKLHGVAAAGEEAGAGIAAGMAEAAAAEEEAAAEAGHLRDNLVEAGAAADESSASMAGLAAAQDAASAASKRLRDEQGALSAGMRNLRPGSLEDTLSKLRSELGGAGLGEAFTARKTGLGNFRVSPEDIPGGMPGAGNKPGSGNEFAERFKALEQEMGTYRSAAEKADEESRQLGQDIRTAGLSGAGAWSGARGEIEQAGEAVRKANAALAEASPVITKAGASLDAAAYHADGVAQATERWHSALSAVGSGGGVQDAISASEDLDHAFSGFRSAGDDALADLTEIRNAAAEAGQGLGAAGQAAGSLTGIFSGLGDAMGTVQPLMMPAAWGALGSAIAGVVPAALSLGAGFGSFAALAAPAFMQVKNGYSEISYARTAYLQAKGVEARDPTKSNLEAEQRDLAALKTAYAQVPADVRPAVKSIQDLKTAFTQVGKTSGIQGDALKDLPKAINDIKGLFPAMSKLGQSAAPEISKMLSGFGKFEKSKGFTSFISDLSKGIGPALSSLKSVGNAIGGLLSDLASPKFAKTGDSFISSIGAALKGITPAAMSAVTGGLHAMTGALNEIGSHGKDLTSAVNNFKQLEKLNFSNLKSGGSALNTLVGPYLKLLNNLPKIPQGGKGGTNPIVAGIENAAAQFGLGPDSPVMKVINAINKTHQAQVKQKVHVKTQVTRDPIPTNVLFPKAGLPTLNLKQKANVKLQVKDVGFDKLFGGRDLSKGVALPPTTIKVNSSGATQAKSQLNQVNDAQKKVSSTKSNVQVHFTGLAAARGQLDTLRSKLTQNWPSPHIKVSLTGAQQATSQLSQLGTAANRMASAVNAGATRASSAVTGMASQMRGAIAPLPGEFRAIGTAAGQGMAAGIEAGIPAAVAAAHSMAAQVEAAAKVSLQTHSPSKKFQKIGHDTILGFILGLEGGKSAVDAAMKAVLDGPSKNSTISKTVAKLQADINDAFAHQKITAYQKFTLTQRLADDNSRLQNLVQQRKKLVSEIAAAEALAKSVTQGAISGASIIGIAGSTQAGLQQADQAQGAAGTSENPYQSIQQGMRSQLAQIKQFKADIAKLKKEGLDKTSIKQLLQAGVSGGLPVAQQILAGGAGGVKQISQLQNEINKASKQLGITGANAAYENASQIGKGLAQGLKDSLKGIDKAIDQIARSLVTSLMTALGASSKAIREALKKLDSELGLGGGSGGGGGAGGHKVTPPHQILRPGPIVPVHPVSGGGGGGGGEVMQPVNLTVVLNKDGKEESRVTRSLNYRHGKRNPALYPNLPGR